MVKLHYKKKRWALFYKVEIKKDPFGEGPEVYLRRWYLILTPYFSIRLHHILLPDLDRDFHDHPWPFVAFMLRGGYNETWRRPGEYPEYRIKRARFLSRHRATDQHKIVEFLDRRNNDAWTLIFTGGDRRNWGFQTDQGWKRYQDYLEEDAVPTFYTGATPSGSNANFLEKSSG